MRCTDNLTGQSNLHKAIGIRYKFDMQMLYFNVNFIINWVLFNVFLYAWLIFSTRPTSNEWNLKSYWQFYNTISSIISIEHIKKNIVAWKWEKKQFNSYLIRFSSTAGLKIRWKINSNKKKTSKYRKQLILTI